MSHYFRWSIVIGLALIAALGLSACASPTAAPTPAPPTAAPVPTTATTSAPTTAATSAPTTSATGAPSTAGSSAAFPLKSANDAKLGEILVDAKGMTLYMNKNDTATTSSCYTTCAQNWPPLTTSSGTQASLASGVTGTLATLTRTDNTTQVTYNGHPLYYWKGDKAPGDTTGNGLLSGAWSVVNVGSSTSAAPTSAPSSSASGTIALLLPETKTTRYETADRPDFEAKFMQLCPNCKIIYSNANQDATTQANQVDAALTNGAKVLVLDPVDSAAAAALADKAMAQGVPVIAYDRLILNSTGVNYYISFDNVKVGQLQAQSLVDALTKMGKTNPSIVMINGSPTDNNAKLFKQGAHSVFDPLVKAGKLTIAKEYDTPDWSPDQAQNEMQQALTALGNKVDGVYAANDGTGGGAIAAMKAAGLSPLPPVTGQDAELAAIQRILAGEQYMTVYKAIKPEAEAAAQLAYDLLTKTAVPASMTNGQTTPNGKMDVPSVLLTPVAVTKDNVKTTVVADGFWTVQQICTANYAAACKAAGLQ